MNTKAIDRTRKVLTAGRWFLILGLVFYSLMTTTPFVRQHSTWEWSGFVLGLIVDVAFIMALSAESTLAKYGVTKLGGWPMAFRWVTGLSSVFLNVWLSVSAHDWVGVAVHLIAPALVMLLAEVGPVYMKALADAEREAQDAPEKSRFFPDTDSFMDCLSPTEPAVRKHVDALTDAEHGAPPEPKTQTRHKLTGSDLITARFLNEPEPERVPPTITKPELPDPIDVAQDFAKDEPAERLSNKEANKIIEEGWRHKLNPVEVAAAAGRHPATVRRRFAQLDAELTV
ncbi:hypothetical protein AB0I16_33350 [Streptomyces sp. NPDC050703]|uniref:hypothetical protein n=1 Tax=Streptomyces sp. NPDC050703 TaxID=3157218 RepID=UPI00341422B9